MRDHERAALGKAMHSLGNWRDLHVSSRHPYSPTGLAPLGPVASSLDPPVKHMKHVMR